MAHLRIARLQQQQHPRLKHHASCCLMQVAFLACAQIDDIVPTR